MSPIQPSPILEKTAPEAPSAVQVVGEARALPVSSVVQGASMQAIVRSSYGPPSVLELQDIQRPEIGPTDVLVRVHASSLNKGDHYLLRGWPYPLRLATGLRTPRKRGMGQDFAGRVEAVGSEVTRVRVGDEVFGEAELGETFAEFASVEERHVARKPSNLSFAQAAAVPCGALTALQGLRNHGRLQSGQRVLINGATGGVGTFAVQIAKAFGAEVTGVCSTGNLDLVRSIGADHVIDYTRQNFTRGEQRYDLLLDVAGNHSLAACRGVLTPKGTYVAVGGPDARWLGPLGRLLWMLATAVFVSQRMVAYVTKPNSADLDVLRELIEAGDVAPVIEKEYPLRETPEALRYLEEGHARGKIVITV